jgi:hypothetical protein
VARKKKKQVVIAPLDHVEETKKKALDILDEIKLKLNDLEPLLADGALDDAGGEVVEDGGR